MSAPMDTETEVSDTFACFGSSCTVSVIGGGVEGSARDAVRSARKALLGWHLQFSRFLPESELSAVNRDPAPELRVSPLMARLAGAVVMAGAHTDGLVDATLLEQIEWAGYAHDLESSLPLRVALRMAPARAPASPRAERPWASIEVSARRSTMRRPPGVKLDSGGIAKGLFADVLAERLADHASFAVNCAGDLMIGGTESRVRPIHVQSPFHGRVMHTFELTHAGAATSGIGRRSWLDLSGRPAHHLLDPSTGRPAFTGVVQATALAPSALIAEIRAKAAVLVGPRGARAWLPDGGVIVLDDGSHEVFEPPAVGTLSSSQALSRRKAECG
jgi:thiamine biosynthesis lipoprotein